MRRAAGSGNDDLETGRLRAAGKRIQPLRGAMRGHDALVAGNAEFVKRLRRVTHRVPVGLASHDDGNRGGHEVDFSRESKNIGRIIGSGLTTARYAKGAAMDYPVLVKTGKPRYAVLNKDGHEEENPLGRARHYQGRQALHGDARNPRFAPDGYSRFANSLRNGARQGHDSPVAGRIDARPKAYRGTAGLGAHRFLAWHS